MHSLTTYAWKTCIHLPKAPTEGKKKEKGHLTHSKTRNTQVRGKESKETLEGAQKPSVSSSQIGVLKGHV